MSYTIQEVEVWAGDIMNRPGMLARVLEALTNVGAELEFIVGRRVTENTSRVFVSPLRNAAEQQAARDVGLVPAAGMHALRVEGPDHPGLAAELSRSVAGANINVRGVSGATIRDRSAIYLAFETAEECAAAADIAREALARFAAQFPPPEKPRSKRPTAKAARAVKKPATKKPTPRTVKPARKKPAAKKPAAKKSTRKAAKPKGTRGRRLR